MYDVLAAFALFLALTSGTAAALSGKNTVYSDDIVNGQVKASDLAQPKWQEVQGGSTTGDACSTHEATFCSIQADVNAWAPWANFGDPYETAAFSKDGFGFVHLKGMVRNPRSTSTGDPTIFVLPGAFRPSRPVVLTSLGSGDAPFDPELTVARIDVNSDGTVVLRYRCTTSEGTDCTAAGQTYLSLDGLEFRAA
jgi:hypothetical protein